MPHNIKAQYATIDFLMDLIAKTDKENTEQLKQAQKTLREIGRLAPRVQAIWLSELISMIGMIVYNQIDSESHFRAGLVVYPAMIVAALYSGLLMDKMEKKKHIFLKQMDAVNGKQK